MNTFFGFEKVSFADKTKRVHSLFTGVSSRYDAMNDLMSLGLHRLWKREFIAQLPLKQNQAIIDVAGGTGDISLLIQQYYKALNPRTVVTDLTHAMMAEGQKRATNCGITQGINWCNANAEALPYPDNTFDGYTIVFGLRNVGNRAVALQEAYRVLKRGGWLYCLEFTPPSATFMGTLYKAYARRVIPHLGQIVVGDRNVYAYLVDSIESFPPPTVITRELEDAGFEKADYTRWHTGPLALHTAFKIA